MRVQFAHQNTGYDFELQNFYNSIGDFDVWQSQYADDRCVSRGVLSDDESLLATSGWSGDAKVWSIPSCDLKTTLKGHTDRVISVRFHPE